MVLFYPSFLGVHALVYLTLFGILFQVFSFFWQQNTSFLVNLFVILNSKTSVFLYIYVLF